MFVIEEELKKLPVCPGVYMHKDSLGEVIYVGKAVNLRNRVRSYFRKTSQADPKVRALVSNVAEFEYITCATEMEALVLECNLIKKYLPRYNVLLKDGKSYPYIEVTVTEKYPRVFSTRRLLRDGNRYFGPYTDGTAVRRILMMIDEMYPLKKCKQQDFKPGTRPCLNYFIGKCPGICVGEADDEQYSGMVKDILDILSGHDSRVVAELEKKMKKASDELRYEDAAKYRDYIRSLKSLGETQRAAMVRDRDMDVLIPVITNRTSVIAQYRVRDGRMSGREITYIRENSLTGVMSEHDNTGTNTRKNSGLDMSNRISGHDNTYVRENSGLGGFGIQSGNDNTQICENNVHENSRTRDNSAHENSGLGMSDGINWRDTTDICDNSDSNEIGGHDITCTHDNSESNEISERDTTNANENNALNGSGGFGTDTSASELLASFIKQYYPMQQWLPREILLPLHIEDEKLLEAFLDTVNSANAENKSDVMHRTKILVPERGDKRAFVKMAVDDSAQLAVSLDERADREAERRDALRNEISVLIEYASRISGNAPVLIGDDDDREYRVEAYDISNFNGLDTVGAMVVYEGRKPVKTDYRKFKVRTAEGDDYGSLREVIYRRLKRARNGDEGFSKYPDIMFIDGGLGQVHAVRSVVDAFRIAIPVIGLAKDDAHRTRAIVFDDGREIDLKDNRLLFTYCSNIQEEVHRFAITFMSGVKGRKMIHSVLEDIPGIGPRRRALLLEKYGSIDAIRKATYEELAGLDGMTAANAQSVIDFFSTH